MAKRDTKNVPIRASDALRYSILPLCEHFDEGVQWDWIGQCECTTLQVFFTSAQKNAERRKEKETEVKGLSRFF
jgi:hypothetical protein